MEQIKIKNGVILVDNGDAEFLRGWNWYIHKTNHSVYARGYPVGNRRAGLVYMHRLIMGAASNQDIDHINNNGLDNRRANLRICSRTQNNGNRRKFRVKTSRYKGVYFESKVQRWRAEITFKGKKYYLGRHDKEEDAAEAYLTRARKLFGDFAKTATT